MDASFRAGTDRGAACDAALAAIAAAGLEAADDALPGAIEHVRGCPVCAARLGRLATAVLDGGDDEITCAECQAWLPKYVTAAAGERDDSGPLQLVTMHLSSCPDCTEEASWLAGAIELMAEGLSPETTPAPRFDLSFLNPRLAVDEPEPLVGSVVRRGSTAAVGLWSGITSGLNRFLAWADRRSRDARDPGPAEQVKSVGLLVPVIVLLAVALGVLWAAMKAIPAMPDIVTARQTAAAQRNGTATAQRAASATAAAANRTGTAAAPVTTSGRGSGVGLTGVATGTLATPTASATGTPTPAATRSDASRDEDRPKDTARPPAPSATIDVRTSTPGNPLETAYPPWWPSDVPPTGYPPPATGSPGASTPGATRVAATATPSTPRPVTPSPSAPPSS